MKLLLDTHSFLWFISGSPRLSVAARALIEDRLNQSVLSMASLWEMAIKLSWGKLELAGPFESLIPEQLRANGFGLLDIKIAHVAAVATLPLHHRDPFDRLLVAQATLEQMPIVSGDGSFDSYGVKRLW